MKRKLEEDNKDITSTSNPQKKQKLGTNEAIIQQVNNIYSLHITWEMLYPHTRGSHPYHLMHFRCPYHYNIVYNEFPLWQVQRIENYYNSNSSDKSQTTFTIAEDFKWDNIDQINKQIYNGYPDEYEYGFSDIDENGSNRNLFLQRTQTIILNDATQMKIINNLVNNLKTLSIPWNSEEFRCKCSNPAMELLPIVIFDINQQIQTQKSVIQSLMDSDLGSLSNSNVLKLITDFVCNDKKIPQEPFIKMINSMMINDNGYNEYKNYYSTFNTMCCVKECKIWNPKWCKIDPLEKSEFKKICFEDDFTDETVFDDSMFGIIDYMNENLYDCKLVRLHEEEYYPQPWVYLLIGRSNTIVPIFAGYLFCYYDTSST
eukprot:17501_1